MRSGLLSILDHKLRLCLVLLQRETRSDETANKAKESQQP